VLIRGLTYAARSRQEDPAVPNNLVDEPKARRAGSAGDSPARLDGPGWCSRGYLPHFDQAGLLQMLSFRLADALPNAVLISLQMLARDAEKRKRLEALLDDGYGACLLRDARIARTVETTLLRFDGERYRLLAWVIMPNHVHALIETIPGWPLSSTLHAWKSYTAKAANRILGRSGAFWQAEYFDRAIRDERHLADAVEYIHNNPVKAGLARWPEEWPFSSAAGRL
jgi:REP element-mobilizing transposase RayT